MTPKRSILPMPIVLTLALIVKITCKISFWNWREYYIDGNQATVRSMIVEANSIILITSYNNIASYMERLITPEIGVIVDNTFRSIYFGSVQYANYQIRAHRKN